MKTIRFLIAASLLFASVSAFASYTKLTRSTIRLTNITATQAEAYQLGLNKLSEIKSTPQYQLGLVIHVPGNKYDRFSLRVNEGGFVTTRQRTTSSGKLGFVGVVHFDYSYIDIED